MFSLGLYLLGLHDVDAVSRFVFDQRTCSERVIAMSMLLGGQRWRTQQHAW